MRQRLVRFGLRQLRLGGLQIGEINRVINLIELLPGAHHRAFFKETLLHDAAHLRLDYRLTRGFEASRQVLRLHHCLRLDDNHPRLWRLLLSAARSLLRQRGLQAGGDSDSSKRVFQTNLHKFLR